MENEDKGFGKFRMFIPLMERGLTPGDLKIEFPAVWNIFDQFKAKVLYAEHILRVEIDRNLQYVNPDQTQGTLTVYTRCNEKMEKELDRFLKENRLGTYDKHVLLHEDTKKKDYNAVRWLVIPDITVYIAKKENSEEEPREVQHD